VVTIPRVHDLLRIDARLAARWREAPAWVSQSIERAPWVVVRRAEISGALAVGIRGATRAERYATTLSPSDPIEVLAPEELLGRAVGEGILDDALRKCADAARAAGFEIGPIGSFGFTLASGVAATHAQSDLDLLVRASHVPSDVLAALAAVCRNVTSETSVRVDVELAYGATGIALAEALACDRVAAKTPHGPRLVPSPARSLAATATRALLDELETTPKPGLVDRDGSGAHTDLSYERLESSALALEPVFAELARVGAGAQPSRALREEIGEIGRRGERAMLAASGGTNTHRGALWALGLLVVAAASVVTKDARAIAERAGELARLPDRFARPSVSNGGVAAHRFGVRGARGEAARAFPHVTHVALPALRTGSPPQDVLLRLMTTLDDTCLLHRGGFAALAIAQQGARESLRAGGVATRAGREAFERLDRALLTRNASPGGAADLLAAAFFLHALAL
jgi:triphosphoribosyl-dephospho-CoA synthase